MQCLTPIHIRDTRYPNQKVYMDVPCGKCLACLRNKQAGWVFRIKQEQKYCLSSFFITLTYDDNNIPTTEDGLQCFCRSDVQKFFKRLRKKFPNYNLRYFLCSEYGGLLGRPHYHMILFNFPFKEYDIHNEILKAWQYGLIHVGEANPASIAYITKYCLAPAVETFKEERRPFILSSRRPGIGFSYLHSVSNLRYHHDNLCDTTRDENGFVVKLPRYMRDKIFTDEYEREQLSNKNIDYAEKQKSKEYEKYDMETRCARRYDTVKNRRRILLSKAKTHLPEL